MKRPEQEIHKAVVGHLNWRAVPGVFFFHPANGGKRTKAEGGILKGLGVKRGVPDLIILHKAQIFGLELKAAHGRLSPVQVQTRREMEAAGATTAVAYDLDEALVILECWGVLRRDSSHRVAENAGATG